MLSMSCLQVVIVCVGVGTYCMYVRACTYVHRKVSMQAGRKEGRYACRHEDMMIRRKDVTKAGM